VKAFITARVPLHFFVLSYYIRTSCAACIVAATICPAPASGDMNSQPEWPGVLDLWPWTWCRMSAMAWTTFLPVLVFLRLRCLVMANIHHTDDMALLPWPLTSPCMSVMWVIVSISVPSLKFIALSIQKIWHIFRLSINRPRDLDFWPLNGVMGHLCHWLPSCQFSASYALSLST